MDLFWRAKETQPTGTVQRHGWKGRELRRSDQLRPQRRAERPNGRGGWERITSGTRLVGEGTKNLTSPFKKQ